MKWRLSYTIALALCIAWPAALTTEVNSYQPTHSSEIQTFVTAPWADPYMFVYSSRGGWLIAREDRPLYVRQPITEP